MYASGAETYFESWSRESPFKLLLILSRGSEKEENCRARPILTSALNRTLCAYDRLVGESCQPASRIESASGRGTSILAGLPRWGPPPSCPRLLSKPSPEPV